MTRKKTIVTKMLYFSFLVMSVTMMLGSITGHTALAQSNFRSPNLTDIDNYNNTGGASNGAEHIVGEATYLDAPQSYFVVYSKTPTVMVSVAGADYCEKEFINNTSDIFNDGGSNTPVGSRVSSFVLIPSNNVNSQVKNYGYRRTESTCAQSGDENTDYSQQFPASGQKTNSLTTVPGTRNITAKSSFDTVTTASGTYYYFKFYAAWSDPACDTTDDSTLDCGVNAFQLQALPVNSDNTLGSSQDAVITQGGINDFPGVDALNFGLKAFSKNGNGNQAQNDARDNYFSDYDAYFAKPCDVADDSDKKDTDSQQVTIYDDDNSGTQETQPGDRRFLIRVEQAPRGTDKDSTAWTQVDSLKLGDTNAISGADSNGQNSSVWFNGFTKDGHTYTGAPEDVNYQGLDWKYVAARLKTSNPNDPGSWSGAYINVHFTMNRNLEYRFRLAQLGPNNNIQFALPYNGFLAQKCVPPPPTDTTDQYTTVKTTVNAVTDGSSVDFTQYAKVSGFPKTSQWGYSELGIQKAVSRGGGKYKCANPYDNQNFDPPDGKNPNSYCRFRCSDSNGVAGQGSLPALLDDGYNAGGDLHCYIAPTFRVRCTWDGPEGGTSFESVTNDNKDGKFCDSPPGSTITRNSPINADGNICATSTPQGKLTVAEDGSNFKWDGDGDTVLPPGRGQDRNNGTVDQTAFRTNWQFIVKTGSDCSDVGAQPYFSVLGGDIAAGPGFGDSCTQGDDDSGITGANNDSSPYNGAGAQLAALALGDIKSFATAKLQTGGSPPWVDSLNPSVVPGDGTASKLAFANTGTGVVGGTTYGGSLGQAGWCVPDYYAQAGTDLPTNRTPAVDSSTHTLNLSSLTHDVTEDGKTYTYYYDNSSTPTTILKLNIDSSIPARGEKIILKVNRGTVLITGTSGAGITYDHAATVDKIPQFQLLVSGSISVDPNVAELDGFYDAQPYNQNGNPVSGFFASCGDPTTATMIVGPAAINTCAARQLIVNGGVAARIVIFNRTLGDINGKFGRAETPAEVIRYSPQFWLPNVTKTGLGAWQSVTSLPPVL